MERVSAADPQYGRIKGGGSSTWCDERTRGLVYRVSGNRTWINVLNLIGEVFHSGRMKPGAYLAMEFQISPYHVTFDGLLSQQNHDS